MVAVEAILADGRSRDVSRERARRLLSAYVETRDRAVRDELVVAHRGLVRWVAGKFTNRGEPLDDLEQVATVGLLKAVDRYDPGQGCEFSTYAVSTMLGELRRHFRDHAWKVHLPRSLHDRHVGIRNTIHSLTEELGRSPTIPEVAERAGTSVERVVEAMEVGWRGRPASLEAQSETGRLETHPSLAEPQSEIAEVEDRADVAALLGRLSPRDRTVVRMRFVQDMTQAEIGLRLGVSQMQISRILTQSLARLRAWAEPTGAAYG